MRDAFGRKSPATQRTRPLAPSHRFTSHTRRKRNDFPAGLTPPTSDMTQVGYMGVGCERGRSRMRGRAHQRTSIRNAAAVPRLQRLWRWRLCVRTHQPLHVVVVVAESEPPAAARAEPATLPRPTQPPTTMLALSPRHGGLGQNITRKCATIIQEQTARDVLVIVGS